MIDRTALRGALERYLDDLGRYLQGEIDEDRFRPLRLSYGLYAERPEVSFLLRVKVPAGVLTPEQAEQLALVAERYGRGLAHVTTRQDIQLHWVAGETVAAASRLLDDVGITTRGACGDSVRNVTACPHGGLDPEGPPDVTPYARAVSDHFLLHPHGLGLPRKFKVAFASCAADCVRAAVNDVGFYAEPGEPLRFRVRVGGGLGAQPRLGVPLAHAVAARDVLAVVEAVLKIFAAHGDRRNRRRARLKYVVKRWGAARFRARVEAEIAAVLASDGPRLAAELEATVAAARGMGAMGRGEVTIKVKPLLGDLEPQQLRRLAALARRAGNGTLRTTADQGVILAGIQAGARARIERELGEVGLAPAAADAPEVVSCPGAEFCALALTRSRDVARAIAERLGSQRPAEGRWRTGAGGGPLRVALSGCPNCCGHHWAADIGLAGMLVKDAERRARPHYGLFVGGRGGFRGAALARRLPGRRPVGEVVEEVVNMAGGTAA